MSKRNEGKKPTQDREIELLKVQVYADHCQNMSRPSLLTIPWAIFIGFSTILLMWLAQEKISLTFFVIALTPIGAILGYEIYSLSKRYKKDFKTISDMIEKVKNGEELPSLEELMKK